jgi:hypothetical protein
MLKRLLIAWPGPSVREIFEKYPDVIFLDERGWWVYSDQEKTRSLTPLEFNFLTLPANLSTVDIRNRLNWWAPVWTRWLGAADDYELFRADSILRVTQIISGFRNYHICSVIFHTGVPHHYDSSLLSVACETHGINQIFLYATVFNNKLIPLIQSKNIFSRKPLGVALGHSDCLPVINDFIQNKSQNGVPQTSTSLDSWKMNSYLARVYVLYLGLRRQASKIKNRKFKIKSNSWVSTSDYSASTLMRIIKKQKEFIKTYEASTIGESEWYQCKKSDSPKLLLAAHYQPEATSFPEGGNAFNHIDIALSLRIKGYQDQLLYKEHPGSWLYLDNVIGLTRVGLWRSADYVDKLRELGCLFLPKDFALSVDSKSSRWYLPVTITGTIAIERALAGLHTIVTGEPWFKGLPGTLPLSEIETLHSIDKRWVEQDTDIATAAKNFLDKILTGKTLTNMPGIGTGRPMTDDKSKEEFVSQFCVLKASDSLFRV